MRNPVNHVIGQPLHLEARLRAWSTYGRGQLSTASAVRLRLRLLAWGFLFRSVVLAGVTGLQGSSIALRRREDIQVEELSENTLGGLVVYDRLSIAVAVGIVVHFLLTRLSGALSLAALLATEQSAGEAANGVLGLVRHLTDLTRGLSRHVLRLTGDLSGSALCLTYHPAQTTFASLLLVTSQSADGILHALHGLSRLVGGLSRRILRLLLAILLLVLHFAHWFLLFGFVVLCPCDATNRLPVFITTQPFPVHIFVSVAGISVFRSVEILEGLTPRTSGRLSVPPCVRREGSCPRPRRYLRSSFLRGPLPRLPDRRA